jgi:ABC-2 type transport system permease protein
MKPFNAFLKMQLNVNYGFSALKYRFTREKKKTWEPILIGAVIIVSLLPMLALYTAMMLALFAAGTVTKQPEMILTIAFMFSQIVILIFGLFYIMGTFYFSKDLETYVPLPLKPYEVIGGKFAVVMINEYLTSMPILLPPIIIYGIGTSQGILYWLKGLVLLAAIPVLPLTVAALLIMVLMRFVNLRRYKDLLAVVGGLLALFAGVGINMLVQKVPKTTEEIQNYVNSGFVDLIGSRFPPSIWATRALSDNGLAGLGYLLLFIGACLLLFALLLWLSNLVFYKALLAGQEVTRKKKSLTTEQMDKQYEKVSNPVYAMAGREWKLLVRTPIYLLNGLAGVVVGPILVITMFMIRRSDPEIVELFKQLNDPSITPYILLGGLGLMLFTSGMNLVASTSLSREGQTIWITKMIPVSARQQVNSKLIVSMLASALGVVTTAVIMVAFFKLPVLWVIGAAVTGLIASVPMVALSLLLDVFHPKLIWNSEQEAIKQNMNGVLGMLLSILILLLLGAVTAILLLAGLSIALILVAVSVVSIILGILSLLALYAVAERKYREMEA